MTVEEQIDALAEYLEVGFKKENGKILVVQKSCMSCRKQTDCADDDVRFCACDEWEPE